MNWLLDLLINGAVRATDVIVPQIKQYLKKFSMSKIWQRLLMNEFL